MVRDPDDAVADESRIAPRMLRRPADAGPAVAQVGASTFVVSLRRILSDRQDRSRRSWRGWAARISGRSDRRLLLALAEAMDTMVTQSDLLSDRLASQEAVTADIVDGFGQEIAQLRAEVMHLRHGLAASKDKGL